MKPRATASVLICILPLMLAAGAGEASDRFEPTRPFLFSVATTPSAASVWAVHYEGGYADRTSAPFGYDGLEQRLGVQGALGGGFTLLGDLGLGAGGPDGMRSMQQAELLKDVVRSGFRLALGLGARREWDGTKALLGRVALGHASAGSILSADVCFERPFAANRDEIDVITSFGWLKRIDASLSLGVELVGEDLEGLWDPDEAEGGARVFVGPTVHLSPRDGRFSLTAGGGPILRASHSDRASTAPRPVGSKGGYTLRLAVNYSF